MEEKKAELRDMINKLYGLIDWFGAYSSVATEIQKACSRLTQSLEEYKKIEKKRRNDLKICELIGLRRRRIFFAFLNSGIDFCTNIYYN